MLNKVVKINFWGTLLSTHLSTPWGTVNNFYLETLQTWGSRESELWTICPKWHTNRKSIISIVMCFCLKNSPLIESRVLRKQMHKNKLDYLPQTNVLLVLYYTLSLASISSSPASRFSAVNRPVRSGRNSMFFLSKIWERCKISCPQEKVPAKFNKRGEGGELWPRNPPSMIYASAFRFLPRLNPCFVLSTEIFSYLIRKSAHIYVFLPKYYAVTSTTFFFHLPPCFNFSWDGIR